MATRYRIGFDIGGTFTDFILLDVDARGYPPAQMPDNPRGPVGRRARGPGCPGRQGAGIALSDVSEIVHGTTLVTNALIERKRCQTGPDHHPGVSATSSKWALSSATISTTCSCNIPTPLVPEPPPPRSRAERMDRDGNTVIPLDLAAVGDAARKPGGGSGVEAIAVCFLHAYRNPAHEQAAGAVIRALYPELSVSLSSDVVAELWEYQRLTTTCANAFVQPLMDRYVHRLERELWQRGFRGALTLMHSAGGLVSPDTARAFPIRLLESGPAGGGLATAFFGAMAGKPDVISFDMGGTTAKACLIENGRAAIAAEMEAARVHRFKKGSGLPIKAPVIDMIEIGAGGGSIARDRRGGPAARRPAFRRRRPRSRLLRPRRHPAHRHRRQSPPRLLRPGLLPRRPHGARPSGPPNARWPVSANNSASPPSRPPGASIAWSPRAWPPPPASTSSKKAAIPAATPWSASAAPAPPMPPASPAPSASPSC